MKKEDFDLYLKKNPLIAILRGITPQEVTAVCDVLFDCGITVLEIPLNSPDAFKSIEIASRHCAGRQLVGAGTVLSAADARLVHEAGGVFVVSPDSFADVIKETKKCGMISMPGFFTPTEGFAAVRAGADYLKLFPARLGVQYVKDLQAVIKTPIVAVGGVNAENIPQFMQCCCAVGIGSALYKAGKSLEDLRKDAEAMVKAAGL
jgi:2-dehydro-3-deoxyphosphogalactonate aldolase